MSKQTLLNKMAHLESENDYLYSELVHVDELMRMVGFTDGLKTVKLTAKEIYEREVHEDDEDEIKFL